MTDKEDPLKTIKELIVTLEENQETLDSDKKLKLKDYRNYVADLNYSMIEIFKKMEKNILKNITEGKLKNTNIYI